MWGGIFVPSSGGTTLVSFHDRHTTSPIANNTTTNLFTFPLAAGVSESINIYFDLIVKKTGDWSVSAGVIYSLAYNNAGSLVFENTSGNTQHYNFDANAGAIGTMTGIVISGTLNASVVTVKINPGNVVASPDSFVLDYYVETPRGSVLTYL